LDFCKRTDSVFIELSTGLQTEQMEANFTLVVCPNTSILVLKMLSLLRKAGNCFEKDQVSITESHQSSKTSAPGTAISLAQSLKFPVDKINSIRETERQLNELAIPPEYLDKHAYHKIVIADGLDEVTIETKVLGLDSYINGVRKIIEAAITNSFEKRRYSIFELIDNNLL
jgi:dihydrodipicolinate reductase